MEFIEWYRKKYPNFKSYFVQLNLDDAQEIWDAALKYGDLNNTED